MSKEVEQDYARKQYRTNKAYPEFVRTITQKSVWDAITNESKHLAEFSGVEFDTRDPFVKAYARYLKQSELKKPYRADSYQDMEQDFLPQDPNTPVFDGVKPLDPSTPPFIDTDNPSTVYFNFDAVGGWCEDDTRILECWTSEPCYLVQITFSQAGVTINGGTSYNPGGVNNFQLVIYTPPGMAGMVTLEASMVSVEGLSGASNDNIFEGRDCCSCDDFVWKSGNPSTIVQDDSIVLEIQGGCESPLYGWEFTNDAADHGFSFASINTVNPSNVLITDAGACGGANIKVTDQDGCEAFGSVRCTDSGVWGLLCEDLNVTDATCCVLSGSPSSVTYSSPGNATLELIYGTERQLNQASVLCGCGVGGGKSQAQCEEDLENCNWQSRCQQLACNAYHCTPESECLTHPSSVIAETQTTCGNPALYTGQVMSKINWTFYLGPCIQKAPPFDAHYEGFAVSAFCERIMRYYGWVCP